MSTAKNQPTATAMMRIDKIKFDHVVPEHIRQAINDSYADNTIMGRSSMLKMAVKFSQDGEPYGVRFRVGGYSLGFYSIPGSASFSQGAFMNLPPEVVAYLSHVADEALAIVQPLVTRH